MKKDIVWLDYARVVGIGLVVFGHALQRFPAFENDGLRSLWEYIYLFHMPLFFIISGFLFKAVSVTWNNIRAGGGKLTKSIFIPYLLYQLLYFPIAFIHFHGYRDFNVALKLLCGILWGDGYTTPFSISNCLPCWFIVSIIQLRLLFLFVPINKYTSGLLTVFSCAFLVLRKQKGFDLYFCLDSTIMAIPYFLLGHYMSGILNAIENKCHKRKSLLWIVSLISAVVVGFVLYYNGAAQMNGPSFGRNLFLNYLAGCIGTFMIFAFSMVLAKRFQTKAVVRVISRNTLFIIFFHWLLLNFASVLIKIILPSSISSNAGFALLMSIVITFGILLISKSVIENLMNLCPILLGKTKQ